MRLVRSRWATGARWTVCAAVLLLLTFVGSAPLGAQTQTFSPPQGTIANTVWSREGTTFTVTYDLVSSDPAAVFMVTLEVSLEGTPFRPVAVSGDVGEQVRPGPGKRISWQSARDTDNQNFSQFRFTVRAVSGTLSPVPNASPSPSSGGAPQSTLASGPSTLIGVWRGTYVGSPAELEIERQDSATFAGLLRVVTKPGAEATEVSVDGRLTQDAVVIRETGVRQRGAVGSWNLGTASGRLTGSGSTMVGSGNDSQKTYQWSLGRVAATAPPLVGRWQGEYVGKPAVLSIDSSEGGAFTGRLTVTTENGREATELQVEGTVADRQIDFREVTVVMLGAARSWDLGTATGQLESGGLQLIGTGRDGRDRRYRWNFVRTVGFP